MESIKCEYLCVSEIFSLYRCCIYCDEMRERELSDPLLLGKMNFVRRNIHKEVLIQITKGSDLPLPFKKGRMNGIQRRNDFYNKYSVQTFKLNNNQAAEGPSRNWKGWSLKKLESVGQ